VIDSAFPATASGKILRRCSGIRTSDGTPGGQSPGRRRYSIRGLRL